MVSLNRFSPRNPKHWGSSFPQHSNFEPLVRFRCPPFPLLYPPLTTSLATGTCAGRLSVYLFPCRLFQLAGTVDRPSFPPPPQGRVGRAGSAPPGSARLRTAQVPHKYRRSGWRFVAGCVAPRETAFDRSVKESGMLSATAETPGARRLRPGAGLNLSRMRPVISAGKSPMTR